MRLRSFILCCTKYRCNSWYLSLIANALIAPIIVNEKITSREWKAIALIMSGDVLAVLFGQHASETYT